MSAKLSPVTGRYVDVEVAGDTYEVFFLENREGIPLLCQHTAGCHNHQWRNLLRDPDVTRNFQVIAYDLPYHGKSDPPHGTAWWERRYDLTSSFFTEFIVQFAAALELDRPVLMGSSMGGVVCLYLARDHPEQFRALIALEAADYTPGFYVDWWAHPELDGGSVAASVVEGLIAPQTPEVDRRLTMWYYAQAAPGVLKGDLYFYSIEHDMRETASQIDTTVSSSRRAPAASIGTASASARCAVVDGGGTSPGVPDCGGERAGKVPVVHTGGPLRKVGGAVRRQSQLAYGWTPVKLLEFNGQRYLVSLYGDSGWAHNLRSSKAASLRLGRRVERVAFGGSRIIALPPDRLPI